ncbi:FlaA1/EpsC-like NDP-sugar epimerase [Paenibacillus aceris]|uniref:FlaA1/EpsC-like NDP-sugar epimerase n=1 Tax=Paenibacillus aceris TaxID=869555 RepID=A0ABS4HWW4_9BACL|nr:FlaA1/EpsC-like NDP-sugar epimerase [Paenibacillus aceris]
MIISLYVSLCWILVATSAVLKSKFSNQEFSFICLLVAFIDTNLYYLFGETFHFFEISKNPLNYVSFSLIQSIIIPLFIAIMINLWQLASSVSTKVSIHAGSIIFLIGMETLSLLLKIVIYSEIKILCWLIVYRLLLFYMQFVTISYFRRMCNHS